MRAMHVEYHAPAVFDDLLEIFVRLARIGRTSATYEFAAYRAEDDVLMVTATQTLVLVDLDERQGLRDPRRRSARPCGRSRATTSSCDAASSSAQARSRRSSESSTAAVTTTRC